MRAFTHLAILAMLAIALPACSSSDPVDPGQSPPTFNVASRVVTLADNSQGLQFAFTPTSENVELTSVIIRNPLGSTVTFNGNNNVFLTNVAIDLQDPNFGFNRISGNWTFTFAGRRAGGDQGSFNVVVTVPVSAIQAGLPTATE